MAILPLCVITTKSRFYYLTYRTKICSRYVDAHFQEGTRSVSLSFLRINVVNTLFDLFYSYCMHSNESMTGPNIPSVVNTVVRYNHYKITS